MYKIYRVENAAGYGPYSSGHSFVDMFNNHSGSFKHPTVFARNEPLEFIDEHHEYFCGFLFLEDLLDWFKGYMQLLYSTEFKIVVYQYFDEPLCGKTQVAFKKKKAWASTEDTLLLNLPEKVKEYV